MLKVRIIKDDYFIFLFASSLSTYPWQPDNCQDSRMKVLMKKVLKNGRIFGIFHSVLTFPQFSAHSSHRVKEWEHFHRHTFKGLETRDRWTEHI